MYITSNLFVYVHNFASFGFRFGIWRALPLWANFKKRDFDSCAWVQIPKATLSSLLHELLFIRTQTKHNKPTNNDFQIKCTKCEKLTAIKIPTCSSLNSTLLVYEYIVQVQYQTVLFFSANSWSRASASKAGHSVDVRTRSLPPSCRWPRQTSPFGSCCRFCPLVPPCSYTWTCAVKIAEDEAASQASSCSLVTLLYFGVHIIGSIHHSVASIWSQCESNSNLITSWW